MGIFAHLVITIFKITYCDIFWHFRTAADKVVSGEGKLESLIVASQEVAASTAQLVVASRVKASRDSVNLTALSQASRGVTQATGQVVATAKDCAQLIEENGKSWFYYCTVFIIVQEPFANFFIF